ncbi:MAG: hypothetical protein IPN36_06920 [Bacteroidetes bacterium]|nr:hypothetical protein [Bacteroidota bacterium]
MRRTKYFCFRVHVLSAEYITFPQSVKFFAGKQNMNDLLEVLKKHKRKIFCYPVPDIAKQEIADVPSTKGINFSKAIIYKTFISDLSDLADVKYDMLVFSVRPSHPSLFRISLILSRIPR